MKKRELEYKDIAGNLPYGLKIMDFESGMVYTLLGYEIDTTLTKILLYEEEDWWNLSNFKPILHPPSDLYRTITHNGKEIIPIVELAKIACPPYHEWELFTDIAVSIRANRFITGKFSYCESEGYFIYTIPDSDVKNSVKNLPQLFDYLHELKIDYRGLIDAGLAIDCNTLGEDNPYK